jgi:hypothetical protein
MKVTVIQGQIHVNQVWTNRRTTIAIFAELATDAKYPEISAMGSDSDGNQSVYLSASK